MKQDTERLFAVNPSVDFLDVNEDTVITVLPDRVWIADVDAEEAAIRCERFHSNGFFGHCR
jgi:hypothetical protein